MGLLDVVTGVVSSLVAPLRCAACDGVLHQRAAFCPACAEGLIRATPLHPHRLAAFAYGGPIADALRRLKFDDRPDLAAPLASTFAPLLPLLLAHKPQVVVPVPLHPARLVERGYNQAALLARALARWIDTPLAPLALRRSLRTSRQTDLAREARAANVANAFVVHPPSLIYGRSVVLVDDVETTGATLDACRRALEAAGARLVVSAVVARAELDVGDMRR